MANEEHRKWVEAYAQDQNLFFTNYAKAHVALSEANHDELLCEMADQPQVEGSYVEPSRWMMFFRHLTQGDQAALEEYGRTVDHGDVEPVLPVPHDDHHH